MIIIVTVYIQIKARTARSTVILILVNMEHSVLMALMDPSVTVNLDIQVSEIITVCQFVVNNSKTTII